MIKRHKRVIGLWLFNAQKAGTYALYATLINKNFRFDQDNFFLSKIYIVKQTSKFIVALDGNNDSSYKIHPEILRFKEKKSHLVTITKTISPAAQTSTWSSHFFFNQDLSSDKNDNNYFNFFEECCRGGNFPYFLGCKHRFWRCITTNVSRVPTKFLRINNRKKCHLSQYMYFNNLICLQFSYSCIKITHNYPNSNHLIHMNKIIKMLSQLLPAIFLCWLIEEIYNFKIRQQKFWKSFMSDLLLILNQILSVFFKNHDFHNF